MTTTESDDELYRLLTPVLELNEAIPEAVHRWTTSDILEWGERSGYLLWARQQPQPISRESALQWFREHKPELEVELRENEAKIRELELIIHAKEKELKDSKLVATQRTLARKPLIECAITRERHEGDPRTISKENMMEDGTIITRAKPYHRQVASMLRSVQDKYRWTSSAMAMTTYLLESRFDTIGWPPTPATVRSFTQGLTLPHRHIWIELEQPVPAGWGDTKGIFLIYSTNDHILNPFLYSRYGVDYGIQRFDGTQERIDILAIEAWTLVIFDSDGEQWWNLHIAKFPDDEMLVWGPSDFHLCPDGECHVEDSKFIACEFCVKTACSWLSWIGLAHLMMTGAFQEQEETKINEIVERATRKVSRPDKPHKFMEIPVEHRYRIVRFDACMRETKRLRDTQEPRGSWVEATKAIDPDAIVYVQRHIAKTERTLRHERYTHKRGQTINVNAHDKRIPMKVSELNKKITRIIASKFEQHSA